MGTGGFITVNPNALLAFVPAATIAAVIALVPACKSEAPFSWVIGAVLGSAFNQRRPMGVARR